MDEPKKLLAIPGIGKGMAANIQELNREGKLTPHQELLKKYRPVDAGVAEDPGPRPEDYRTCCGALSR